MMGNTVKSSSLECLLLSGAALLALGGCVGLAGGVSTPENERDIKELLDTKKTNGQVGQLMSNFSGAEARKKEQMTAAEAAYEEAKKKAEADWQSNSQGSIDQLYALMNGYQQNIIKLRTHSQYLFVQTKYFGIQRAIRALEQENTDYQGLDSDDARSAVKTNNSRIKNLSKESESLVKILQKRDDAIRHYAALIRVGLETLKQMNPAEYEAKKAPYEAMLAEMEGFLAASPSKPVEYRPGDATPPAEPKSDDERQKRLDELAKRFRPVYEQQK